MTILNHVKKADAGKTKQGEEVERVVAKSRPARNFVSGPPIGLQHVEFELISQPRFISGEHAVMDSDLGNASDSQVWNTEPDPNSRTGKPVARSNKITVGKRLFPRNLALLPCNVEHTEQVFTKVRQELGRPKEDKNGAGQDQSALCLRSPGGLVPRSCSASRSSVSLQHGDTRCERGGRSRISSPVSGVSNLTKFLMFSIRARGDSVRQHEGKLDFFQNIFN